MIFDPDELERLAAELTDNANDLVTMRDRSLRALAVSGRWSTSVDALLSTGEGHRNRGSDLAARARWLRSQRGFELPAAASHDASTAALSEVDRLIRASNHAESNGATDAELGTFEGPLFRAREVIRSLTDSQLVALVDAETSLSALFATVTRGQREMLVSTRTEILGSVGPIDVRVEANRILIEETVVTLRVQADAHAAEAARLRDSWWPPLILPTPWSGPIGPGWFDGLRRSPADVAADRARRLRSEIAVLEDLTERQIVLFDWSGAGRVAEWIGPLAARDVAVSLPGTGTSKLSMAALRPRAEVIVDNADASVAVVTAMVYDAPDNLAEAALDRYASGGRDDIGQFVAGLVSADRHIVVIGHSYGATALGEALQHGLADSLEETDDVVILGSPGVHADTATDLGVSGTVWAAQVDGDEIAVTGALHDTSCLIIESLPIRPIGLDCELGQVYHHGVNPVHPSFGATVFATGEIPDGDIGFLEEFGDEHSEYWAIVDDRPSEALANLIRIIEADYENVTLVER